MLIGIKSVWMPSPTDTFAPNNWIIFMCNPFLGCDLPVENHCCRRYWKLCLFFFFLFFSSNLHDEYGDLCTERLVLLLELWTAAAPSDSPAYTWVPRQPHETSRWYPSHQHHLSLYIHLERWKAWLILSLSVYLVLFKFHAMDTLHRHGYDLSSALSVLVPQGGPVLCRDEMEEWSSSEANLFEEALEKYGKDFNDIRQDFVSMHRKLGMGEELIL